MRLRLLLARAGCVLLHGEHDPLPVAPVTHIGIASGVQVMSGSAKTVCRRCWAVLEVEDNS